MLAQPTDNFSLARYAASLDAELEDGGDGGLDFSSLGVSVSDAAAGGGAANTTSSSSSSSFFDTSYLHASQQQLLQQQQLSSWLGSGGGVPIDATASNATAVDASPIVTTAIDGSTPSRFASTAIDGGTSWHGSGGGGSGCEAGCTCSRVCRT